MEGITVAAMTPELLDEMAVNKLSDALLAKLKQAREKGRTGWWSDDVSAETLSTMLREHVNKGDPVDVAAFAAFLVSKGQSITKINEPLEEVARLRELAGAAYAGLGAMLPENWLDALYAASAGEPFTTDGLLPYVPTPHLSTHPEQVQAFLDRKYKDAVDFAVEHSVYAGRDIKGLTPTVLFTVPINRELFVDLRMLPEHQRYEFIGKAVGEAVTQILKKSAQ